MDYFTSRNLLILGLAQLGVIAASILGASAAHKWYTTFRAIEPLIVTVLMRHGWLALLVSLAWMCWTLVVFYNPRSTDEARMGVVLLGFLLLLLLLVVACAGAAVPLLRLMGIL